MPISRHRGVGAVAQMIEYLSFFALAAAELALLQPRRRYGVVQLHNVPDFLVFAGLVPRLSGARIILDLHDLAPEFYASRFGRSLDSAPVRLVRLQERASAAFADHVLTVTETWREALISRGLAPDHVSVFMNVADDAIFSPRVRTETRDPGILTVLYHGTVTYRYGLDVVLEALARVRDQVSVRLIIHGTGEFLDELRSLSRALRLDDRVSFSTAALPTRELALLIGSADLGVVPYRSDTFTDGILPTKLMEYAAVGVPAIASRTPAIADYFDEGMVRFVTPGSVDEMVDALIELAGDPAARARLAAGIRRFVAEHSFEREAERYVSIVRALHEQER
jgi:glycosyltransferase involved in cell wall biosynthesis